MTLIVTVALGLIAVPPSTAVSPRVDLELVTEPGFPLTAAQRWVDRLKDLGASGLRIRSARYGDEPVIENRGTERNPSYRVVGVLTERNQLIVPGAALSLNDPTGIARWIERLRQQGIDAASGKTGVFGLTKEELLAFHERMTKPISSSTKDRRAGDVTREIVTGLGVPYEVSPGASRAFARDEVVPDELVGLTGGTALAAVLRPLGLAVAPQRNRSRQIVLRIAESGDFDESWPLGWPPEAPPFRVAPSLFERINVEIKNTKLSEAITVIQKRVEVPFLFDHNALARHQIDLDSLDATYPEGRAAYLKILDRLLFDAQMTSELRVDERGKPFLWITSRKR
jgi:hypothetical protein